MTGTTPQPPTGTEARVCADIARRQQLGIAKYGQTVADNPLSLLQWLQHAYEECLDQAVYLRRAIEELQATRSQSHPVVTPWFFGADEAPVRDGRYQARFCVGWREVLCEFRDGCWWIPGGGLYKPTPVDLRAWPGFHWRGLRYPTKTSTATGAPA